MNSRWLWWQSLVLTTVGDGERDQGDEDLDLGFVSDNGGRGNQWMR